MIPRGIVAGGIERVRLRRTSRAFGIAEVRLAPLNVRNIRVFEEPDGTLNIRTPPDLYLQPLWKEAIAREIGVLWAAS